MGSRQDFVDYDGGLTNVPPSLRDVAAIAAGRSHNLALVSDAAPLLAPSLSRLTVPYGGLALLRATAVGARPLSYQWRLNGTNLPGATSAALELKNVQFEQAGAYAVVVSNARGETTGSKTELLIAPWAIPDQPRSQSSFLGANLTFKTTAAGKEPFAYQWQLNGANIAGATNSSLALTNAQWAQAGLYSVIVSNSLSSLRSVDAKLSVGPIAAWGKDYRFGNLSVPYGLSNVLEIALSADGRSLAVTDDGKVLTWSDGQNDIPAELRNVQAIAGTVLALVGDGPPMLHAPLPNPTRDANGFKSSIPTQCGRVYRLEYKNSLAETNWTASPLVAGTGRIVTLTDPTATGRQRFCRVRRWDWPLQTASANRRRRLRRGLYGRAGGTGEPSRGAIGHQTGPGHQIRHRPL